MNQHCDTDSQAILIIGMLSIRVKYNFAPVIVLAIFSTKIIHGYVQNGITKT